MEWEIFGGDGEGYLIGGLSAFLSFETFLNEQGDPNTFWLKRKYNT